MQRPLVRRSFLLTIWQERRQEADLDPVWRFGLEDTSSAQRRHVFTTLEEVFRYVEEELGDGDAVE